jgi:hypothetical protein
MFMRDAALAEDTEATIITASQHKRNTSASPQFTNTLFSFLLILLVFPPLGVGNILVLRDAFQHLVIFFYPVVLNCRSLNLFIFILHPREHYDGLVPVMYYCT